MKQPASNEPSFWGRVTEPYTPLENLIYGSIWVGIVGAAVAHFLLHWF